MHIVYTVCGERVKAEFLMSLKSLYLFAISGFVRGQSFYHIHVLSDGTMDTRDMAFLRPLSNFKVSVHATFPGATMLFKQCSTERMYLHQHDDFAKLDQIFYVDTDTLWLDDPVWWWTHFAHMRTQHAIFGLAQNANSGEGSWYTNAPIPHYGERGLNAGVLMASLATVRASNFTAERDAIIERYSPRGLLPLGDQDVLNIYGHDHPKHIYEMPCIFNFRRGFSTS
ncbi:g11198 [Coccomyxa elongata]